MLGCRARTALARNAQSVSACLRAQTSAGPHPRTRPPRPARPSRPFRLPHRPQKCCSRRTIQTRPSGGAPIVSMCTVLNTFVQVTETTVEGAIGSALLML
jgi:hypothetical protein